MSRSAPRSRPRRPKGAGSASFPFRQRYGRLVMFLALGLAAVQLLWIQVIDAPQLSAEAANQRTTTEVDPALRGSITDRNSNPIAFTMEAKALTFQPARVRKELEEAKAKSDTAPDVDSRLDAIAKEIHDRLGDAAPEKDLKEKLHGDDTFVYLARSVDPNIAAQISDKFPEVGLERQDIREYPGGSLAANLVGATGWDGHGLLGLEDSLDSTLAGTDGSQTYDRGSDGAVIPGSWRDKQPAVDGSSVELTIDSDLQYYVQQQVQMAKDKSGAKDASAVVLDSHTGEVLAMSNDSTFNPAIGVGNNPRTVEMGNLPVSTPFEPGSVNKIVTAAAAIEYGLTTPDEVLEVPGNIQMSGVSVKDAWDHGVAPYTATGVFGKSSNVGTLMLAQRVGEDRYADMLSRFGLGQRTDVGLPGESAGSVPSRDQWSGGTFANLPIGQGLSMTLLQMTGMYQAIANDGVRIPPRIVKATVDASGNRTETETPEEVTVVSPQTASTVRDMFRSVTQDDTGNQRGTGVQAAVDGYQISGKTGTAQQVDPACKCYSNSNYWITFAGIAPADNPRYVVGIMLNAPTRSADGSGGQSAAPLFHNIASWMLQRDSVPMSPDPGRRLVLQAD
ncbi:peptidoglycan D,D-transpeptidase FtsI family protein [Rhodococcus opacus]|uniref:Penicillin-binding protein PbpB n=3 Tax=Rhodococcus opacus TaxID=37919 RepID=A0AAX3YAK1_RHOOP|nr:MULTISPECIES: penicillin-binding protein 2 [Rhodococcus]NHU44081.1 penicillin-binding protein 2 [Rhodococcus sp. A14]MCZ4586577.1 penicillin-binding protein 2 [Rhodococcus opacus]MDI9934565.1 penicillin-binding protein 2 [Rhodococcus sp. IEGM 1351]MDJ0417066.1 penicillin-binding protein 2 [Rhodococcus opacus]MDV6247542.1 penicillin-binding protein 2 [Rhodococcus opacus]